MHFYSVTHHPAVDVVGLPHPVPGKGVVGPVPRFDSERPTAAIPTFLPAVHLLWAFAVLLGELAVPANNPRTQKVATYYLLQHSFLQP